VSRLLTNEAQVPAAIRDPESSDVHIITASGEGRTEPHMSAVHLETEISLSTESQFFANLSGEVTGVFVATYRPLPPGTNVEIEFGIPGAVLRATGRVGWVRESGFDSLPGVGIEFVTTIEEEDRRRIEEFSATRVPLYHDS